MKSLGITGNIGTGKSSVLHILKNMGITTYDLDVVAKEFYKADSGYLDSAEADETISVGFCKKSGSLTQSEITTLIDSINRS